MAFCYVCFFTFFSAFEEDIWKSQIFFVTLSAINKKTQNKMNKMDIIVDNQFWFSGYFSTVDSLSRTFLKNVDAGRTSWERRVVSEEEKLEMLKQGDTLVLAGSIPSSMPSDIYSRILEALNGRRIRFVVDATKNLLLNVLQFRPFLIKPNNHELGEIFGVTLVSKDDVVPYAKKLQEMGAVNVLVSMGKDGAILVDEKGAVHDMMAPDGKVVNTVGAGDSMVAGFLAGYYEKNDYEYAFKLSVATGSASAFSKDLATRDEIFEVLKNM